MRVDCNLKKDFLPPASLEEVRGIQSKESGSPLPTSEVFSSEAGGEKILYVEGAGRRTDNRG
jgi:hypothetical protein